MWGFLSGEAEVLQHGNGILSYDHPNQGPQAINGWTDG